MTREEFATLVGSRPVILDGATGTNLQKAGMPVGVCPEQWILENPGVLIELQERYVEAGTDIFVRAHLYGKPDQAGGVRTGEFSGADEP